MNFPKRSKTILGIAGLLSAMLLPAGLLTRASAQAVSFNYFPTGKVNDGKFLALAGTSAATLAGDSITVSFTAPPGTTNFQIGVFDGDTGGYTNGSGQPTAGNPALGHWDIGVVPLEYSLFADPRGDARGRFLVGRWMGNGGNGTIAGGMNTAPMPDNGWFDIPVSTGPEARNLNGHYYYVLKVRNTSPSLNAISSFKVRSDAVISILAQAVSLYTPLSYNQELAILSPPGVPSNYDGTWDINISVPTATSFIEVWDGDCDWGNSTNQVPQTFDDNDPDTPGAPYLPPWAPGTPAVPEGVGISDIGGAVGKGSPADDNSSNFHRRSPNIFYEVYNTDSNSQPVGNIYTCANPSGNREWERFLITTNPAATRTDADYGPNVAADGVTFVPGTGLLPAGNWRMRIRGMDAGNLNAYRFLNDAVGVGPDGELVIKVPPQPVVVIGDYVWLDLNRDAVQDVSETGIAGVKVEILGSTGVVMDTMYTNLDGFYYYPVPPNGTYTVRVAASNFLPGGPLAVLSNTTGANQLTRTVSLDDDLTYDFGYAPRVLNSSLGDRVWLDANGDTVQDSGEAGIVGVTVELRDGSGNLVGTQVTGTDGLYLFTQLEAGNYTVSVVASTLPAGLAQTYDLDGLGTGHTADAALGENATRTDVDFGYKEAPVGEPGIGLVKTASSSQVTAGLPVTYSYTVTNTGAVALTDVTVKDDNATPSFAADDFVVGTVASLAPGASTTLTKTVIPPVTMRASNGTIAGVLISERLAGGNVKATFIQSTAVVDNTYGTGSAAGYRGGSGKGHTFKDLVNSDHAEFQFKNAAGAVVLDFYVDDLTKSSAFPSGYGTLGVSGGDGYMIRGSAAHVLSANTSISDSLNQSPAYYGFTTNSPTGDANWEVRSIYSVVVSAAAFGTSGFGSVTSPDVHNSPAKIDTANLKPTEQDATNTAEVTAKYGNVVVAATATATVRVK